jgi:lysozyme
VKKTFYERVRELAELHEDRRKFAYKCPAGKITVGIGRNLEDKGLSDDEIDYLFKNDFREVVEDLKSVFPGWSNINDARKAVLFDMRFNLGGSGFRTFRRFISAVKAGDYVRASEEMKDSAWFHQVGTRSERLCRIMRAGKF